MRVCQFRHSRRLPSLRREGNLREWRNWQTRMIQVHVFSRTCRFKSCFPHHEKSTCESKCFFRGGRSVPSAREALFAREVASLVKFASQVVFALPFPACFAESALCFTLSAAKHFAGSVCCHFTCRIAAFFTPHNRPSAKEAIRLLFSLYLYPVYAMIEKTFLIIRKDV